METASKYVKHSKRNHITSEDLKRGLMMELFVFSQHENLQSQVESIKKYLYEDEDYRTYYEWSRIGRISGRYYNNNNNNIHNTINYIENFIYMNNL